MKVVSSPAEAAEPNEEGKVDIETMVDSMLEMGRITYRCGDFSESGVISTLKRTEASIRIPLPDGFLIEGTVTFPTERWSHILENISIELIRPSPRHYNGSTAVDTSLTLFGKRQEAGKGNPFCFCQQIFSPGR